MVIKNGAALWVLFFLFAASLDARKPLIGYVDREVIFCAFPGIAEKAASIIRAAEAKRSQAMAMVYSKINVPGKNTANMYEEIGAKYAAMDNYWDDEMTFIVQNISRAEEKVAEAQGMEMVFNYGKKFDIMAHLYLLARGDRPVSVDVFLNRNTNFRYFDSPLGMGGREITREVVEELRKSVTTRQGSNESEERPERGRARK